MNEDIKGIDVYLLDSFDYLATLLEPGATFVATEIPEFNRRKLTEQLRIASGEDEFAEGYISLLESKHDMFVSEDFTKVLQINIPYRNPKFHPTYKDLEVRKGNVKPIQIKAGSYALIGKSSDGCSWGLSWYFVQIVPKNIPQINENIYEQEFMKPWDGIRKMLLVDRDRGDLPRISYEQTIDNAYEMGYNKALGRKE